jgi:glycosyltransferase involved in cell wall biosynthesis
MKILVFTSLYPNNIWTHHGVFVKERMTRVARLPNCEVQVVAPVPYFPPIRMSRRWLFSQVVHNQIIEDVKVYHPRYFMIPKIGMIFQGLMMFLGSFAAVKRVQQDFDFDVIDAHYVYPDGFAAVLLGMILRKPVVVSARGTDINLYPSFPLVRQMLKATLNKAHGLISVSEALKNAMQGLGVPPDRIFVIPNGVDTSKFYPVPKDRARKSLKLPDDKRILLSVGGLVSGKGFHHLINALHLLRTQHQVHDLMLIIAGEGIFRPELELLIRKLQLQADVKLAGDIPHEELRLWYSAADLFCLASSREGWPNVVLEALACGVPVAATAVGGIPEIIRLPHIGRLTQSNDHQSMAKLIEEALATTWDVDKIVKYAHQHSWEQVACSVHMLLQELLKPTNNARKKSSGGA